MTLTVDDSVGYLKAADTARLLLRVHRDGLSSQYQACLPVSRQFYILSVGGDLQLQQQQRQT